MSSNNNYKEPYQINTLEEAAVWLKGVKNPESEITTRDLLELGKKGHIKLFAAVGADELKLYTSDGQEITMPSDGLIPLASMHCNYLVINKSLTLNNFEMTDGISGKVERFNFKNTLPAIKLDDLRVKGTDLLKFYIQASISDVQKAVEKDTQDSKTHPKHDEQDIDMKLAALFDSVSPEQLETMFPDNYKWKNTYCRRAKEMGLNIAWVERGKFNPYLASLWWLNNKNPFGWDLARLNRKLAASLPSRNIDKKHLFIGDFD